jgi:pantothenate kinase
MSTAPPSISEAAWLAHLQQQLRQRVLSPEQPPFIVGLVGMPGSGKTTLATQLARALGPQAIALGMDGFHLTRAQLAAMPDPDQAFARRGAPWTFDPQALVRALRAIQENRDPVAWPGFAHDVGDPVANAFCVTAQHRLVMVEGLYLLHREHGWDLQGLLDECAYLDTPLDTALQRLALRHQSAWGISEQAALARIASNDSINAGYVQASASRAQWRVRAASR